MFFDFNLMQSYETIKKFVKKIKTIINYLNKKIFILIDIYIIIIILFEIVKLLITILIYDVKKNI